MEGEVMLMRDMAGLSVQVRTFSSLSSMIKMAEGTGKDFDSVGIGLFSVFMSLGFLFVM